MFAHNQVLLLFVQLNGFKYSYLTLIILFNIIHLFALCEVVSSIVYTNSFICTMVSSIAIQR